jgi:hypothetical protein
MDEPSQQEAGPSTSKREQREQRRQIELQGQKELTYEEISEGSNIPVKVWTRAVSLVYWDDAELDINSMSKGPFVWRIQRLTHCFAGQGARAISQP